MIVLLLVGSGIVAWGSSMGGMLVHRISPCVHDCRVAVVLRLKLCDVLVL